MCCCCETHNASKQKNYNCNTIHVMLGAPPPAQRGPWARSTLRHSSRENFVTYQATYTLAQLHLTYKSIRCMVHGPVSNLSNLQPCLQPEVAQSGL